jgi:hypothetical protein
MYNILLSLRTLLLLLLFGGLCPLAGQAQAMQFASKVVAQDGIVSNDDKAADSNLATNATIKPTLLLGFTRLRVSFPTMAAANKEAGMYLKSNILLSAALLGGATINTFYNDGTTSQPLESYLLSNNLLSLNIQASGITKAAFMPTQQFNQIELVYFAALALGQDIEVYEAFSTVNPLPVALISFQAKATPAGVALSWATASERGADYFALERAADAQESFQTIGRVQCAGTTTQAQSYQFVDATAAPGVRSYYRLRQVDLDGTETFGPVLAVQGIPLVDKLVAYPSPTAGPLTVLGGAGAQFTVLDQLGRPVHRARLSRDQPQLDVRSLPSGQYFLQDEATGQRTRFAKAD